MIIAVSCSSGSTESQIDLRFGRCPFFSIFEVKNGKIVKEDVVRNPGMNAFRGAGIQAAQLLANRGVNVVITGRIGPNAFSALSMAGIKVVIAYGMTARKAAEKYIKGELEESKIEPGRFGFGWGRRNERGLL